MQNTTANATRYAEYLRKSTDDKEKQVLSLSSQRDVIDRLSKSGDFAVVETIEEKMSAKRPGRPGFSRMVRLIRERRVDGIVTWAPHRLSRNSLDIAELINLFDTGYLREIVTDGHTYRNNPMDMFMLGFHCLQAKFENDNKAIDVRNGMRKCADNGVYPGRPPLGYLPDRRGIKGARRRDIDPEAFPIVRKVWDCMLRGTHSPREILALANGAWGLRTAGGRELSKSGLYHMLNNPFYYGEYEWPRKSGNWYKGIHRPMVSREEYDRVQAMIGRTGRARPSKHYFAFGGCLLHCGTCGCAITGFEKVKTQKNGNVHRYEYYYCGRQKRYANCDEHPISARDLEAQIESLLTDICIPKRVQEYVRRMLETVNERTFKSTYAEHEAYRQQAAALKGKLNRLIDLCASGAIDEAQLLGKKREIMEEDARLQALIAETDIGVSQKLERAITKLSFSEEVLTAFKNGTLETKRGVLVSLCTDLRISGKKLDLTREKWIQPVKEIARILRLQKSMYRPVLSPFNKDEIENMLKIKSLCSLLTDVLTSFGADRRIDEIKPKET